MKQQYSTLQRRKFLKLAGGFTGGAIGALGLHPQRLSRQATHYGKALAQTGVRKRALLVGINKYAGDARTTDLRGALTDVEMQHQLLVHRFGFDPSDIIKLTDEQTEERLKPTRENILKSFQTHLIESSNPNDVVVFHYSGHGSKVETSSFSETGQVAITENTTIVPSDFGTSRNGNQIVKDISGDTLFLLHSLLPTPNATMVIDCCFAGGIRKYRARSTGDSASLPGQIAQERELQARLLDQLGWSPEDFLNKLNGDVEKGLFLYAADRDNPAIDFDFNGFSAGVFTYALTQYLWQRTESPTVRVTMPPLQASVRRLLRNDASIKSVPEHNPAAPEASDSSSLFHTPFTSTDTGEAVITQVLDNNKVTLWLGGVSASGLVSLNAGTKFVSEEAGILATIERREALNAIATIETTNSTPLPSQLTGTLLREQSRVIQTDLSISIALDDALASSEKTSAAAQLAQIKGLNLLATTDGAAVILGRLTADDTPPPSASVTPEVNSLGLFYTPRVPMPDAFGLRDEPIAEGIHRLKGKFKQLLIHDLLHGLINADTSHVSIAISLDQQSSAGSSSDSQSWQTLNQLSTQRANSLTSFADSRSGQIPCLKIQDSMRIQVTNQEPRELYLCAFVINPLGQVNVIFPWSWDAPDAETLIPPSQTLTIPPSTAQQPNDLKMIVTAPAGLNEVILVASDRPLGSALRSFQAIADRKRGTFRLNQPAALFSDLLTDLSSSDARGAGDVAARLSQRYELSTDSLAIVSLPFQSVGEAVCQTQ